MILLMEEIPNNHLGCFGNLVNNGINYLFLNWCKISSINRTSPQSGHWVFSKTKIERYISL